MKKILPICFILILLFGGCTLFEDESDQSGKIDEGESIELENQNLIFSSFEIVTVDLGDGDFTDGEIEGTTLQGDKIPMVVQGNTLTFMVPRLNQGTHKLVFLEKNKPFNISFDVKPFALKESPQTVLASYRKKYEDKIKALEQTKDLMSGESKIAFEKDLELLKKGALEQFALASNLTESELTEMVMVLQANEKWLQEVSDAVETISSSLPNARILDENPLNREERSNRVMIEFVKSVIEVVSNINKVVVSGLIGGGVGIWKGKSAKAFGLGVSVGTAIGKFLFLKDFETLTSKMNENVNLIDLVMLDSDMNANQRASYVFQNDSKTELIVERNYRKLFKEDASSSIAIVKNFAQKYKEMIQAFFTLKEATDINLSYQPNDFTQKTEIQTSWHRVHSDHLSISGITNPKVTGSVIRENGRLFLTFKTNETDAQEFNFKLAYNHVDYGNLEKTLDAAVVNTGCSVKLELTDKNVLTATATGYGPFKFVWSSGENVTTAKTHGIKAARFGDYSVTVTDQNGCESQATATVPCSLKIDVLNTSNTFTIEVLDGFPPYYYTWSNGGFTNSQTLPPGNHSVTIRDGLGCEILHTFTIGCDMGVNIQRDGNNVTAQVTGGTAPYTYSWSNGATTASQSNLAPGTYTVVVQDKIGCEKSASITIGGPEYGTFTDPRDGNVYKTVKIGNQTWFAENLRYSEGIPQITSQEAWVAIWNNGNPTGQPAWVYYDNNSSYNTIYGKLYNWYAVNTGTLCPQGWHIPTTAEWTILANFLGGHTIAGGKMKSITGWNSPNTGATNESGFTGLPGGNRNNVDGKFYVIGLKGIWWSSSPNGSNNAWGWDLNSANGTLIYYSEYPKARGFSCRCLKD
jgi:uncharacterized protein (TIGR02145 family)